jgi:hypothetical protein
VDQEFLPMLVQIALMPSPTPVGQPLWTTTMLDTKHGRSMRVSAQQQLGCTPRSNSSSTNDGWYCAPAHSYFYHDT